LVVEANKFKGGFAGATLERFWVFLLFQVGAFAFWTDGHTDPRLKNGEGSYDLTEHFSCGAGCLEEV